VHHPSCLRRQERHAGVEPAFSAWKAGTLAVVLMPHVWPGGIEPPISCSQGTRLTTRLWPVGGPPRIRTGNLLLAGELLYQLELAAHAAACYLATGSQDRSFLGAHSPPGIDPPRPITFRCAVVNPQARAPIGWCLAYVPVRKKRPPGVSLRAASGRCLHLYPEASPASRVRHGCKNAGMTRCLSSRSRG
jgi:hypothetical protein